jgi:hypothetical protein
MVRLGADRQLIEVQFEALSVRHSWFRNRERRIRGRLVSFEVAMDDREGVVIGAVVIGRQVKVERRQQPTQQERGGPEPCGAKTRETPSNHVPIITEDFRLDNKTLPGARLTKTSETLQFSATCPHGRIHPRRLV